MGFSRAVAGEATSSAGDLARLQGKWTAKAGPRREIQVVMDIKGREVSVAHQHAPGTGLQGQGELKLDETTTPRSLDWKKFSGPDQQPFPAVAAVYKLEGETFTVCNGGFLGSSAQGIQARRRGPERPGRLPSAHRGRDEGRAASANPGPISASRPTATQAPRSRPSRSANREMPENPERSTPPRPI